MKALAIFLKVIAPIFVLVAFLHLALGAKAEVMLGAQLSSESLMDPVLDSQNRFYGAVFALYGVLLFVCAGNIPKYETVLRCILWVFFAGGLARLVSIATHGLPSAWVLALFASEVLLPPILLGWLSRVKRES